jgi:cell division septation protein DedD
MVEHAARSLDVQPADPPRRLWTRTRVSVAAAAAVVLLSSTLGVGASAYVYQRFSAAGEARSIGASTAPPPSAAQPLRNRDLPADAAFTILIGSYPASTSRVSDDVRALTSWLERSGMPVFYAELDRGVGGRWHRVMAGAYTDRQAAQHDLDRLKIAAPALEGRIVAAAADGPDIP